MRPQPLIAGGATDPNLLCLLSAFTRQRIEAVPLLIGDRTPSVVWELGADHVQIDGHVVRPDSVFIRHDVFGGLAPRHAFRALAWTTALDGWRLANPGVRMPNRARRELASNKPAVLLLARSVGLAVPETIVTNDREAATSFLAARAKIAKPVSGGDLARRLDDAIRIATATEGPFHAPAIVQEELVPPEVRIYLVGPSTFAFETRSPHLDYRAANDAQVMAIPVPDGVEAPLRQLASQLGLDFCAADFKATADGSLRFLELNTNPMFARHDLATRGALAAAIARWLVA